MQPRESITCRPAADAGDTSSHQRVRRGVIGILSQGERLLLIRRALNIPKGGTWCFPGGHVDPGETPRLAVIRELAEELGIQVRPAQRIGSVRVFDSRHILAIWRVEQIGGTLLPNEREISELRWLLPSEVRTIQPGLPSNERVLDLLGL